jgi:hypothetical protein
MVPGDYFFVPLILVGPLSAYRGRRFPVTLSIITTCTRGSDHLGAWLGNNSSLTAAIMPVVDRHTFKSKKVVHGLQLCLQILGVTKGISK